MKKIYLLLIVSCALFVGGQIFAQQTSNPFQVKQKSGLKTSGVVVPTEALADFDGEQNTNLSTAAYSYKTIAFRKPLTNVNEFESIKYGEHGLLMFTESKDNMGIEFSNLERNSLENAAYEYLTLIADAMQINDVSNEFAAIKTWTDKLDFSHIKMQQQYQGIKVYGGQIILHGQNGVLNMFNGTYFPTPELESVTPRFSTEKVEEIALGDVAIKSKIEEPRSFGIEQLEYETAVTELIIYHSKRDFDSEKLAWHITLRPNFMERWEYFVDANTGEIINKYNNTCSDGPTTANATDLNGVNRTVNTYQANGYYYMINTVKSMFNAGQSTIPDNAVGAIITLDANNTNNENITYVASSNNSWGDASSVSAHYNGSITYDYYLNTHSRNSINGQGGSIISIVNVADQNGGSMANAYWNGQAMFYGNGGGFFSPLAGGLDVAAHEMTHGVVQNTANLEYQDEPGAINEAMADIAGSMVDRSNWQIGETVTPVSTDYPTGTLRDMSNPHNGGSSFNDRSYQPMHVNEKYTGSQDNGGVHINSGIINYAYYQLAESISKNKAEKLFYRALANYMTKTSQFIDCRLAFEQAAKDLYGNGSTEQNAVANAFYAVGIGESGTGGGGGSGTPDELEVNPGQDFLLTYDVNPLDFTTLYISNTSGQNFVPISQSALKRRPSLVDNGSFGVMITTSSQMKTIEMSGGYIESPLSNELIWDNVAVSKNGNRIAAITTSIDSAIWVYDFTLGQWARFHLYSPTFTQGEIVNNVLYADALEWDYSGQYLVYDAYNELQNNSGENIDYWDVGFLKVWDNASSSWGDGEIFKLFAGLPEGVSIGNPSFSKNTPFILAFDYFNSYTNETEIMGANIETGEVNTIFENAILGFPNYSKYDDKIVFSALDNSNGEVVGVIDLADDKISPSGGASILVGDAKWPLWYATGNRSLLGVDDNNIGQEVFTNVFPNPVRDNLNVSITAERNTAYILNVTDLYGRLLIQKNGRAEGSLSQIGIDVGNLPNGTYLINISVDGKQSNHKFVKVK